VRPVASDLVGIDKLDDNLVEVRPQLVSRSFTSARQLLFCEALTSHKVPSLKTFQTYSNRGGPGSLKGNPNPNNRVLQCGHLSVPEESPILPMAGHPGPRKWPLDMFSVHMVAPPTQYIFNTSWYQYLAAHQDGVWQYLVAARLWLTLVMSC